MLGKQIVAEPGSTNGLPASPAIWEVIVELVPRTGIDEEAECLAIVAPSGVVVGVHQSRSGHVLDAAVRLGEMARCKAARVQDDLRLRISHPPHFAPEVTNAGLLGLRYGIYLCFDPFPGL